MKLKALRAVVGTIGCDIFSSTSPFKAPTFLKAQSMHTWDYIMGQMHYENYGEILESLGWMMDRYGLLIWNLAQQQILGRQDVYLETELEFFSWDKEVASLFETEQQKDRAYGKGGRLLKSKNGTFAYDKLGNLTRKEERNGDVWLYEWNVAGMLAKVIRPDDQEVSFGYDALGRRVWKKFRQTTTHFVWDGNVPLHEYKTFDTEKEQEDNQLTTWIFEEDNFIPVAKIKREKRYSVITDHLGTPNALYDEEGLSTWHVELDSYGRARLNTGSSLAECPFRYQGQYEDKETGLYYNRLRDYSPEEGVYISQDPIRLNGGIKLYGYIKDTNLLIDLFGLDCSKAKKLKEWLKDNPELLAEVTSHYKDHPEWWGIDPDKTDVFYKDKASVDAIRAKPGESGGHHPHGLALGGPEGQTLTPTNETRTIKNPTHSKGTWLQRRVINIIKTK